MKDIVSAYVGALSRAFCATLLLAVFVVYAGAGSAYSQETSFGVRVTEISDTPDPVGVGEKVTYEITVQNSGSALVEDIAIRTGTPT